MLHHLNNKKVTFIHCSPCSRISQAVVLSQCGQKSPTEKHASNLPSLKQNTQAERKGHQDTFK